MAFALRNTTKSDDRRKKSPLAGWLGRRSENGDADLPEIDVHAGVSRALRDTHANKPETPAQPIDENNPIRLALGAIEAALYAIDSVRDILEQACDVVISAKDVEEPGGRALLAERYDEMRASIDEAIDSADQRAKTLISKSHRHIDVSLDGKARYSISAMRLDASEKGLNLSPPRDAFARIEEIDATLDELDGALARADRAAAGYCKDAQFLISRMYTIAAE